MNKEGKKQAVKEFLENEIATYEATYESGKYINPFNGMKEEVMTNEQKEKSEICMYLFKGWLKDFDKIVFPRLWEEQKDE